MKHRSCKLQLLDGCAAQIYVQAVWLSQMALHCTAGMTWWLDSATSNRGYQRSQQKRSMLHVDTKLTLDTFHSLLELLGNCHGWSAMPLGRSAGRSVSRSVGMSVRQFVSHTGCHIWKYLSPSICNRRLTFSTCMYQCIHIDICTYENVNAFAIES